MYDVLSVGSNFLDCSVRHCGDHIAVTLQLHLPVDQHAQHSVFDQATSVSQSRLCKLGAGGEPPLLCNFSVLSHWNKLREVGCSALQEPRSVGCSALQEPRIFILL